MNRAVGADTQIKPIARRDRGRKERNMVYLIQVGHNSRRSAFIKLHEKVILVEDDIAYREVERHFKDKYEGFEVIVKAVKAEPIGDIEHHTIDDDEEKLRPQSCIGDFKIKYTEDEKRLHDEYTQSSRTAKTALDALHEAIRNRYKQLFYSDIDCSYYRSISREMELTTDTFETRCLKFPVKADLFIQAAKDCNNSVPESAPPAEPKTTPEDEPFLPDSVLDTEITSLGAAETETPPLPIESTTDTEVAGNNTTAYAADDIPF